MEDFGRDTDMASPPASHPLHNPIPSTSESQSAKPSKSRRKIVNDGYVYQPYIDRTHHKDTVDIDGDFLPSSSSKGKTSSDYQASATRILELRGLERRIVQLLETAGQAIQILSGDSEDDDDSNNDSNGHKTAEAEEESGKKLLSATTLQPSERNVMIKAYADEKAQKFETLAAGYATLVNEIQSGLRRQFHYLTKAGISSSQVPFKNVVYGEEKELETWLNAVDVLRESADRLIGNVERELLDDNEEKPQQESTAALAGTTAAPLV
ncbi:hypothetical protein BGX28_007323 [Mortierella sp. GBA30]|nr:hypothetical protein BGX28_007323 [Mortierella sp. GBA30]